MSSIVTFSYGLAAIVWSSACCSAARDFRCRRSGGRSARDALMRSIVHHDYLLTSDLLSDIVSSNGTRGGILVGGQRCPARRGGHQRDACRPPSQRLAVGR